MRPNGLDRLVGLDRRTPRRNFLLRRDEWRREKAEAESERAFVASWLLESSGQKGLDILDDKARMDPVGQERPARVSLSRTT